MDEYTENCTLRRDMISGELLFGPVKNMEEENLAPNEHEHRNVNGDYEDEGENADGNKSGDANGDENGDENDEEQRA